MIPIVWEYPLIAEHEKYVTSGRARVVIGDETFEVEKDDVVFIPAEVPHSHDVLGDESFEFLCMVPNKKDEVNVIG